jgi:hypothetical protein
VRDSSGGIVNPDLAEDCGVRCFSRISGPDSLDSISRAGRVEFGVSVTGLLGPGEAFLDKHGFLESRVGGGRDRRRRRPDFWGSQ